MKFISKKKKLFKLKCSSQSIKTVERVPNPAATVNCPQGLEKLLTTNQLNIVKPRLGFKKAATSLPDRNYELLIRNALDQHVRHFSSIFTNK